MQKTITAGLSALALFAIGASALPAAPAAPDKTQPPVQLAQSASCKESCEKKRKSCTVPYTFTNSFGVRGVSVEGTRICWAQYRACIKNCS